MSAPGSGVGERPTGLQWGAVQPGTDSASKGSTGKTTRSATFDYNHMRYTVTVDYDRSAIMTKYGVANEEVDVIIEKIFANLKLQHLSALAGYSVSTSLEDMSKAHYQPLEGGTFKPVGELKNAQPQLFQTIQKVVDVFAKYQIEEKKEKKEEAEKKPEAGEEVRKQPEIQLTVEKEKAKEEPPKPGISFGLERVVRKKNEPDKDAEHVEEKFEAPPFSDTNPILQNATLFDLLESYNENASSDVLRQIKDAIGNKAYKPAHRDEVISAIKNPDIRKALRQEMGLLKKGDVVCPFSQGNIEGVPPNAGINACGTICRKAIEHLTLGKAIDSEETMRTLILEGIKTHGHGAPAKMFDEEVMLESPLKVTPYFDVEQGMKGALDYASGAGAYLALTFATSLQNETLLVYYPEKGKPVLFDSHGKEYLGVSKGASLRQFENNEALLAHFQTSYVDKGFNASFFLVQKNT